MSIPFDYADYCKGSYCTNRLTARTDAERGYCGLCWKDFNQADEQDHFDNEREEKKIKGAL